MEINFYQFNDILYKAISPLLLKVLEEDKKALILCKSEQIKEIDDGLWQFPKTKFIPHATNADKLENDQQPVFIIDEKQNINNAQYLIMTKKADDEFLKQFEKIFYFFADSNLADARKFWKECKEKDFQLNFYKKENDGWVKIDV